MCCFVILLLSNEMQMSVRRFSAIPHLREHCSVKSRVVSIKAKSLLITTQTYNQDTMQL